MLSIYRQSAIRLLLTASVLFFLAVKPVVAQSKKVILLLPAPVFMPQFAPILLAYEKGYFANEGVDISFEVVPSMNKMADQLSKGRGHIAYGTLDTALIYTSNNRSLVAFMALGRKSNFFWAVPEKQQELQYEEGVENNVALLPGFAGHQRLWAPDNRNPFRGSPPFSFAYVDYLQGLDLLRKNKIVGIFSSLDYIVFFSDNVTPLRLLVTDESRAHYGLVPVLLTTNAYMEVEAQTLTKISRAVLRSINDMIAKPRSSLKTYLKFAPQHATRERELQQIFNSYRDYVYGGEKVDGSFNVKKIAFLIRNYQAAGWIKNIQLNKFYSNDFSGSDISE